MNGAKLLQNIIYKNTIHNNIYIYRNIGDADANAYGDDDANGEDDANGDDDCICILLSGIGVIDGGTSAPVAL